MPHLQQNNTYDALGNLTGETDALGDTVTQPNGETVSYTYDSHGNRATMTYPNGKTVKYSYDDMNRLVSVKLGQGTVPRPTKKTANESHYHGARSQSLPAPRFLLFLFFCSFSPPRPADPSRPSIIRFGSVKSYAQICLQAL